jgi:hypothetical protein
MTFVLMGDVGLIVVVVNFCFLALMRSVSSARRSLFNDFVGNCF